MRPPRPPKPRPMTASPVPRRSRRDEYARGFEDGRVGAMRATGPEQYHVGYDDGLDQYDQEHPQ